MLRLSVYKRIMGGIKCRLPLKLRVGCESLLRVEVLTEMITPFLNLGETLFGSRWLQSLDRFGGDGRKHSASHGGGGRKRSCHSDRHVQEI